MVNLLSLVYQLSDLNSHGMMCSFGDHLQFLDNAQDLYLGKMRLSMASEILYSLHDIFTKDAVLVIFVHSVDRFRLRISLVNSCVDQTWRRMEIRTAQQRNFNESSKR